MRASAEILKISRSRLNLVAILATVVSLAGCASSPFSHRSVDDRSKGSGRVVRPEVGAEYDILVAEMSVREADFAGAQAAFERALEKDPDSATLHFRLAQLVAQNGDLAEATRLAQRGETLDPEDLKGRLFLARLYRLQRNLPAAERVLLNSEGQPVNPEAALALYEIYLETGQLSTALGLAQGLVEADPKSLGAAMAVATVYERMGRMADAEAALLRVLDYHPDRFVIYARLARMRRARGDGAGEIQLYRDVLVKYPDHYGTLVSLGEAQISDKDMDGAIETYVRILEVYPDDPEVVRRLASLEFGAGRYEDAAKRLRYAVDQYPEQVEFRYSLGQVLRVTSEPEEAILVFDEINSDHPLYVESRMQIALLHQEQGRPELALEEVEIVRELRSDRGLDFHAATLRAQTGDLSGGAELLKGMLKETPNDEEVLYQLGVLYGNHNDPDQALFYMEQVLIQNPQNPQALNYVGYTWAERGQRLDEAEEMIRQAVRLSPGDGYIVDSLGWVYFRQAQPLLEGKNRAEGLALLEKAIEQLDLAVELTGGDPVVSEHLGDVYLQSGRPQRALEYYEEAVELEPRELEQPDLFDKIETLKKNLSHTDGAARELDAQ